MLLILHYSTVERWPTDTLVKIQFDIIYFNENYVIIIKLKNNVICADKTNASK